MAETRKYLPSTSAVGEAIRAALGDSVRPVAPGSTPPPEPERPETPAVVSTKTFTFGATPKRDA